jgi:hypothetical protein
MIDDVSIMAFASAQFTEIRDPDAMRRNHEIGMRAMTNTTKNPEIRPSSKSPNPGLRVRTSVKSGCAPSCGNHGLRVRTSVKAGCIGPGCAGNHGLRIRR